jgi:hypothetical protein
MRDENHPHQKLQVKQWCAENYMRGDLLECLEYSYPGFSHRLAHGDSVPLYNKMNQVYDVFVKLMPDKLQYMRVPWKDIYFDEQKISNDWRRLLTRCFERRRMCSKRNDCCAPTATLAF